MKAPIRVTITGAAGQIGYATLFRIANGAMLGPEHIIITDDPKVAFRDTEIALLIGARPRGKGMERKDLIEANGVIFSAQGKLLNEYAARHVKVLVVGKPAHTNALISMKNGPGLDPRNF